MVMEVGDFTIMAGSVLMRGTMRLCGRCVIVDMLGGKQDLRGICSPTVTMEDGGERLSEEAPGGTSATASTNLLLDSVLCTRALMSSTC